MAQKCACSSVPLLAWQSLPTSLELEKLEEVGTLVEDPYDEPVSSGCKLIHAAIEN